MPTTPYHHGDLRAALLATAEARLAESGVDGLSLRELAREVGVSHAAPRRHFPDRQSLLDALVVHGFGRLGEELDVAMSAAPADFAEQLTAFATGYVGFATRHPALVELMFLRKGNRISAEVRAAIDRTYARPMRLIARAQADGEIDGEDPDRVAMAILAVLQGLATLVLRPPEGSRSTETLVRGTIHTLLTGLRPRG